MRKLARVQIDRRSTLLTAGLCLACVGLLALPAAAEVKVKTQSWGSSTDGFTKFNAELMSRDDQNLLKFPGSKLVDTEGIADEQTSMLTDGTGGVWVGDGRIHLSDARPSRVAFYLGRPRLIREIRVLTSNSDSRTNQDYEIRLAKSSSGRKMPKLPAKATFTSGDKVIGPNRGPCISSLTNSTGGNLSDERYDVVEFTIYPTHRANAGSPARTDLDKRGWCTIVELQVLADPKDPELFKSPEQRAKWLAEIDRKKKAAKLASLSKAASGALKNIAPLQRAIDDLAATYPKEFKGNEYKTRLKDFVERFEKVDADFLDKPEKTAKFAELANEFEAFRREVLLSNPLLDFDRLLLLKRGAKSPKLGLPQNWQSNSSLSKKGFDDSLVVLSPVSPDGEMKTLFKPEKDVFVGDVDLNFDADKMLFSTVGKNGRWQVCEMDADGENLHEITGSQPDVDSYDACYLPDGRIIFTSTACFIGVPCVYGSSHVTNTYIMDADGENIRQLTFDQEHNWCPVVLPTGRVLYSRWEYADTPHSNTRLLFHMNPDGTAQMEFYGSNSYWPNSTFYARPVPGHPTKVVGVVGGHHDNPRMGELVIFDPAQGRHEATGAVQRIPGYGKKVEPIIRDGLTRNSWPKFLHPYPLSEKYFLVSMKRDSKSLWGLYLVDVFDNMTLIKEMPGYALMEPIPFRPTRRPPTIPDRVNLASKTAMVYIPDVYVGDGLKGIPRGDVKKLRLFTYHFSYQGMGGLLGIVGMDGPWDIKRVVGTVPVYPDGSAKFLMPANMPISIQPLDEEGKALQLMRSWTTAMPGEVVQCTGCHEPQNSSPIRRVTMAVNNKPATITPWYGDVRGFSYPREVQPVIDKYCVGCHNGEPRPDGQKICNLRGDQKITDWKSITPGNGGRHRAGKFSVGYAELHRFVRRPGIESDYHLLEPMEFHADTTQLVQMLKKGHHNVKLDEESWDRLVTWIDLNCPYHGTWGEELNTRTQRERRRDLLKLYAGIDDDPEAVPEVSTEPVKPIMPEPWKRPAPKKIQCAGWPFDAAEAKRRQEAAGGKEKQTVDLGEGTTMELVLIPAGEFVMGSDTGGVDEQPRARVRIDKPFWMGSHEVTNQQYAQFDAEHDSRVETKNTYQFGIHGYPMNRPEQPVVRVTWQRAMDFCRWLSAKTGRRFTLPSEAEWEYACRAGTETPMFFGDLDADFGKFANFSDTTMTKFASNPYTVDKPLANPPKYDDWIPKDARFNDNALLSVAPGSYEPNPWGLFDMHGNVAEWTRSTYRPYPFTAETAKNATGRKVVRGGSWRDRPKRGTSSFRVNYLPHQKVYNVGFRVVCEAASKAVAAK